MKYSLAIGFLLSFLCVQAQRRIEMNLGDYSRIKVSGNLHLILKSGENHRAVIEYNDIDPDNIQLDVNGNTLKISIRPGFHGNFFVRITAEYSMIRHVQATGSALVDIRDVLQNEFYELVSSAGAEINLSVDTREIDMKATTGGKINIAGTCASVECVSSTGGIVNARKLTAQNAYIRSNSGGTTGIRVSGILEATVATGGTVNYEGSPEKVTVDKILGGNVNKL